MEIQRNWQHWHPAEIQQPKRFGLNMGELLVWVSALWFICLRQSWCLLVVELLELQPISSPRYAKKLNNVFRLRVERA
jgi:hypothetical protein